MAVSAQNSGISALSKGCIPVERCIVTDWWALWLRQLDVLIPIGGRPSTPSRSPSTKGRRSKVTAITPQIGND